MNYENFEAVNHERFVDQYMSANPETYGFRSSAIQIYPLSLASSRLKPPTPLFRTAYSFLLLFSHGGGRQQVDNEIIELNQNDVLFIRGGHLNAIESIDSDTDGYFIHLDDRLLPQIFTDSSLLHRLTFYPKQSVSPSEMDWLCKCCELLFRQKTGDSYSEQIQSVLLKAIALTLAKASAETLCQPDRQSEITMLFKGLLYENFITNREVHFYADLLAVSENYLNRCVNQTTNKPPKQHINEMVIVHSKVLLQDRSKNISQVAFELNFSDPSYFGRLFKQLTGQTPTEYRNYPMQGLSGKVQDF